MRKMLKNEEVKVFEIDSKKALVNVPFQLNAEWKQDTKNGGFSRIMSRTDIGNQASVMNDVSCAVAYGVEI